MNRNLLKLLFILCAISLNSQVYASDEYYDNTDYNNHPQIVDLGLSICWADRNVGANSPEEPGGRYYYADTICADKNHGYNEIFISDARGTKYDVARVKWGGAWRLPTPEEVKELFEKCTFKYSKSDNKVTGVTLTGPNGNSIFLPLPPGTVIYTSDHRGKSYLCYYGLFNSFELKSDNMNYYDPYFVRPVINKTKDGSIINDYPNPSEDSYNAKVNLDSYYTYKDEHYIIDNIKYSREAKYGEYDRVKITGINSNGTNITSIKIPKRVYISNRWEDVYHIAPDAFNQCHSIETFDTEWSNFLCIDGVLYNSAKTEIIAIAPAKKGTLKIEDGVQSINSTSINPLIEKLILPTSVIKFNLNFNCYENLKSIEIAEDNPNYCSIDGVLFSKDKRELLCYLHHKQDNEYTIPASVGKIGIRAFQNCQNLKKITISENVTVIGYGAFEDCKNLTEVISLPLNPPTCEVFNHRGATLYVYSDALDAYENEWGEFKWSKIEVLDPMPIFAKILIALGCLIALGLIGFLGYKYLLPYIRQKQVESKIKREEKKQQEQKLKQYKKQKTRKKMGEKDLLYKKAGREIFYGALVVLILPIIESCYGIFKYVKIYTQFRKEPLKAILNYFTSNDNSDFIFMILLIISYFLFFQGLTQFSKSLKRDYEGDDVLKIRTGFLLFIIAEIIDIIIPLIGFVISLIIYLIGYIKIIKGSRSLSESTFLSEEACKGLKKIKLGYQYMLIINILGFLILGPILVLLAKIILSIIIINGWKLIKDSDPDDEIVELDNENVAVEADPQLMADMEQKSDEELLSIINSHNLYTPTAVMTASNVYTIRNQESIKADMEQKSDEELLSIINSPNLYAPTAVMTASNVYTIRNQESIMVELQAKSLVELQGIVSNQHAYCEAYIDIAKAVLSHKLS